MNREQLRARLRTDEGSGPTKNGRLMPYFDCCGQFFRLCACAKQGKLTIGYGRNIEDKGLRPDEADFCQEHDIDEASSLVLAQYPWAATLDGARFAVLVNMMFNMGPSVFGQFTQTLRAVKEGRYTDAASLMLESKWARQVGARATRLSKQMASGELV